VHNVLGAVCDKASERGDGEGEGAEVSFVW